MILTVPRLGCFRCATWLTVAALAIAWEKRAIQDPPRTTGTASSRPAQHESQTSRRSWAVAKPLSRRASTNAFQIWQRSSSFIPQPMPNPGGPTETAISPIPPVTPRSENFVGDIFQDRQQPGHQEAPHDCSLCNHHVPQGDLLDDSPLPNLTTDRADCTDTPTIVAIVAVRIVLRK